MADTLSHEPPVGFELSLTRSPQTDAALLPLEVRPAADQTRRQMLVLSELDLELAFEGGRTLGKDVEDQPVPIQDARVQGLLEVAFLAWTERLIDEDQLGTRGSYFCRDLIDLAAADEELRIRAVAPRIHFDHDGGAGRFGQRAKFLDLIVETRPLQTDVQQQRAFTAAGAIEQPSLRVPGNGTQSSVSSSSMAGTRTLRAGTTVEMACL